MTARDVVEVDELPIGAGQRPRRSSSAGGGADDRPTGAPEAPRLAELGYLPGVDVEEPPAPALWEARKMRRPLQVVVGKTVNWRMRKVTGVETSAGLMSDEHADAIAEPLAEVFNRFEPMRAIAAKQTEIALGIAIYDYVQATVVQAGRDVQLVEDARAHARVSAAASYDVDHPPPPPPPVFPLDVDLGTGPNGAGANLEDDDL